MAVTASNLIQGPANLWIGAFGATEPTSIAGVAGTGTPGVGWTDLGGTKDGVSLKIDQDWSDLTVDQIVDVVARRRTGRKLAIATNLAEPTLANLAYAIANTAPTGGLLELDNDISAFAPGYYAVILEGIGPGGFKRRVILRKALPSESVEVAYKKDGQTLIPATWSGHYVSGSIKPLAVQDAVS